MNVTLDLLRRNAALALLERDHGRYGWLMAALQLHEARWRWTRLLCEVAEGGEGVA